MWRYPLIFLGIQGAWNILILFYVNIILIIKCNNTIYILCQGGHMCKDYIYANEKLYNGVSSMARSRLTLPERVTEARRELLPALIKKEMHFPSKHYQEVDDIKSMPQELSEKDAEKVAKIIWELFIEMRDEKIREAAIKQASR